ncbi:hypothetical protein ACS127_11035 [Amphibacillus sp. Q70]|uniref:hypothetical protein n=1 Tax=Amphibacillus sp. Q70 TaxID=3453416 RepID=UPI003F86D6A5
MGYKINTKGHFKGLGCSKWFFSYDSEHGITSYEINTIILSRVTHFLLLKRDPQSMIQFYVIEHKPYPLHMAQSHNDKKLADINEAVTKRPFATALSSIFITDNRP